MGTLSKVFFNFTNNLKQKLSPAKLFHKLTNSNAKKKEEIEKQSHGGGRNFFHANKKLKRKGLAESHFGTFSPVKKVSRRS